MCKKNNLGSIYISIIEKIKKRFPDGFTVYDIFKNKDIFKDSEILLIISHISYTKFPSEPEPKSLFIHKERDLNLLNPEFDLEYIKYYIKHGEFEKNIVIRNVDKENYNTRYLILSLDSEFKYLEYVELKEARKNAKWAFYTSISAIIIALISPIIIYTISLNDVSEIKIKSEQFNTLSAEDQTEIKKVNENLEQLIETTNELSENISSTLNLK